VCVCVRERTQVLAAAVQNLEKLQEAAHSMGALDRLTAIYANRDEAHEVFRHSSMHACKCVCVCVRVCVCVCVCVF
jgi:hypothetical protein